MSAAIHELAGERPGNLEVLGDGFRWSLALHGRGAVDPGHVDKPTARPIPARLVVAVTSRYRRWDCRVVTTGDVLAISRLNALLQSGAARTIRVANGLTLAVLANEIGCTPTALVRWELGNRKPRRVFALRYLELAHDLLRCVLSPLHERFLLARAGQQELS